MKVSICRFLRLSSLVYRGILGNFFGNDVVVARLLLRSTAWDPGKNGIGHERD
jgi:hypothetical protein